MFRGNGIMQHRSQSGDWRAGRPFTEDGDRLPIGKAKRDFMEAQGVKQLLWGNRIRALPGPEYHEFDRASQDAFWRSPWQLSPQSNRMGYRLQGQILKRTTDRELLSHGLLPGVVQVPHNGQPIVLMNDAQTTVVTRVLPVSLRLICTIWRKFRSVSRFILSSVHWKRH